MMDESYTYSNPNDTLPVAFMNWKLIKYDLNRLNYPIKLYGTPPGIVQQFIFRQYAYQTTKATVKPEYNDIILDCGAGFGETALFFAHETGPEGQVYSFEFVKSNIEIFTKNISLNPELAKRIIMIERAVWDSESCLFFTEDGPASKVGLEKYGGGENQITSISIDEMVKKHALKRVDFIKMDIEGSELRALKGAVETLRKYKPKLAISVYHNPQDFTVIPEFIRTISPEYQLYLGHYSIHAEETILYAIHIT